MLGPFADEKAPRSLTAARRAFQDRYRQALSGADLAMVVEPFHRGRLAAGGHRKDGRFIEPTVFTDVTEIKRLQRQLALTGRAVAGTAHRIKNILMGLAGGMSVSHIASWNGSAWSPLGAGLDNVVQALAVLPDGDVVLASGELTGRTLPPDTAVWLTVSRAEGRS